MLTDPSGALETPLSIVTETRSQAQAAAVYLKDRLTPEQSRYLTQYARLVERPLLTRKLFMFRHGLYYTGAVRNIALYAVM